MSKPIYVLNGPNLNLLGEREPDIYGATTLVEIRELCEARAAAKGRQVVFRQSNREGELIEWVHEARTEACAVVINAAGYGHTSISLHDALQDPVDPGDRLPPFQSGGTRVLPTSVIRLDRGDGRGVRLRADEL